VGFLLEADTFWPSLPTEAIGIKDGFLVPPGRLDDPERISYDRGPTVVTPGWVNAHSHLELSGARGISYHDDFSEWIRDVLEFKIALPEEEMLEDFRDGCRDLLESGVVRVIDHCDRTDLLLEEAQDVPLDVILFKELVAFDDESIEDAKQDVNNFLESVEGEETPYGIAPHAPYSVHPKLFRWVKERLDPGTAISSHLHEVHSELEFAESGSGMMLDLLKERSGKKALNPPYEGTRPLPYFMRGDYLKKRAFCVHLNYLNEEDYRWLEASSIRPVFCPKSYDYFGHDTLPVEEWSDRNVSFALGTDSRASNDSLDMLDELRKLDSLTDELSPDTILKALTSVPSEGLGMPDRGVLTWGTPADLSVFEVSGHGIADLARGEAEAVSVWADGQPIWSSDPAVSESPS
jgi:cytosine/adenosine deaminase-related metal-dependent hydrolase